MLNDVFLHRKSLRCRHGWLTEWLNAPRYHVSSSFPFTYINLSVSSWLTICLPVRTMHTYMGSFNMIAVICRTSHLATTMQISSFPSVQPLWLLMTSCGCGKIRETDVSYSWGLCVTVAPRGSISFLLNVTLNVWMLWDDGVFFSI